MIIVYQIFMKKTIIFTHNLENKFGSKMLLVVEEVVLARVNFIFGQTN